MTSAIVPVELNEESKPSSSRRKSKCIFKCSVCGYESGLKSRLQVHLRSHIGLKPFSCKICGKSYTVKQNLVAHEISHETGKILMCETCKGCFRSQISLESHQCENI